MARYSSLVGRRVEAHYRAGDIHISAIGVLTSDSGKSVFLEDRFSQGGKEKNMRVEIPYEYVIRIEEVHPEPERPRVFKPAPIPRKRS
jgi:hypothetical protein